MAFQRRYALIRTDIKDRRHELARRMDPNLLQNLKSDNRSLAGASPDSYGADRVSCAIGLRTPILYGALPQPTVRRMEALPAAVAPSEEERRVALIATCRHGQHQFSSPDEVFVDLSEK